MSLRDELVAKMDILAEYEAIGLRVAKGARPNAKGWLSCHALNNVMKAGIFPWKVIIVDHGKKGNLSRLNSMGWLPKIILLLRRANLPHNLS